MTSMIAIFVGLAFWHFIYESALAPILRLRIGYGLFALRDRLRRLKAKHDGFISDQAFRHLEDTINAALRIRPYVMFSTVVRADRAYRLDPSLQARVDKRCAEMDACTDPEFRDIRAGVGRWLVFSLYANHGGWAIYVIPVLAGVLCVRVATERLLRFVCIPGSTIDQMMPACARAG